MVFCKVYYRLFSFLLHFFHTNPMLNKLQDLGRFLIFLCKSLSIGFFRVFQGDPHIYIIYIYIYIYTYIHTHICGIRGDHVKGFLESIRSIEHSRWYSKRLM